jgi:putative MFS transporter
VLGRAPELPPARITLLGSVCLALFFDNYDQAMLTAAAKQIAASFALQESDLAALFWRVQLGSVVAFLFVPFIDQLGRRRVFLGSLVGLSLATFLSAFAQDVTQFITFQMLARAFMVTCAAAAYTIISEELPAAHRGWGIGIVGAAGSIGYGAGILLFGVVDFAAGSWRILYLLGAVPLLLLPRFRRNVTETRRFLDQGRPTSPGQAIAGLWRPFWGLLRMYPGRALGVGAVGALSAASMSSALAFSAYFVQVEHGWVPWQYALMALTAGALGILGNAWAGRAADIHGRRRVGFVLMASFPLWALCFFRGPELLVPLAWVALVFSLTGTSTVERALGAELFPTWQRGTASGWVQLSESLGRVAGLAIVDWATPAGGSSITAVLWISLFSLLGAGAVLLLPETRLRELEDISR